MQELHFSPIDLRNKLSKGRVNDKWPIITHFSWKEQQYCDNFTGQSGDLSPCPVVLLRD